MNCLSARNRLLALADPADVPDAVAGHLATCQACSAWHALLIQVDAVLTATPFPESNGQVKSQLLAQFKPSPRSVKPERAAAKSTPKIETPVVVPAKPSRSVVGERMARLWPAGLVAAAVLVGALSWAIFGGKSNNEVMVAEVRDPMLEKVVKAKVDLDKAETNPDRLKVLDQLAREIHAQAGELSKLTPGKEMDTLAAMYDKVVIESLVPIARSLSEDEKKLLLDRYQESLNSAEQTAYRLASEAPVGSDVPLRSIAKTAGAGKNQLARMKQGGA
jgi:anti-sigma factor RsiW